MDSANASNLDVSDLNIFLVCTRSSVFFLRWRIYRYISYIGVSFTLGVPHFPLAEVNLKV